jgi:hypothetical protein
MTVSDTSPSTRIRIARHSAACATPGCLHPIWPGCEIVKRPGGGWAHFDCSRPGSRQRRRQRP